MTDKISFFTGHTPRCSDVSVDITDISFIDIDFTCGYLSFEDGKIIETRKVTNFSMTLSNATLYKRIFEDNYFSYFMIGDIRYNISAELGCYSIGNDIRIYDKPHETFL